MSPQEKKDAQDPNYKYAPIDKQDACYMQHDIGYGNCRDKCKNVICPSNCEKQCFNGCDYKLSECLIQAGMMKDALDEVQRILAIPTFQLQPAFRNGGYDEDGIYYQFRFELF